ncbi:hypothetical protein [Dyadobacter sp. 676]|uniref:Uncharacterized protein n=1 Tax=Dyadobacter sp. 676 TaxID=3088362 RepID=A0AAU8FHJ9_9BACT
MKTFITSAMIAALAATGAQAQTVAKDIRKEHRAEKHAEARNEVSSRSKDSFYADFGQVSDARWTRGATVRRGHIYQRRPETDRLL